MFDHLEARRLFAAVPTAVLKHGILTITGTNGDDQIQIQFGVHAPTLVAGESHFATAKGAYIVNFNNTPPSQNFESEDVKEIRVYGLAGRDEITGPKSFDNLFRNVPEDPSPNNLYIRAEKLAPLYVEGGSGSDRITGGTGDDTLVGGRGNDILTDQYGRNTLYGGAGRDSYNTTEGSVRVVRGTEAGQMPYVRQVAGGVNAAPDRMIDINEKGVTDIVNSDAGVDVLRGFGGVVHINSGDSTAIGSDTDTVVVGSVTADVLGGGSVTRVFI